ncbi:MAG: TonB-dependent receptor [Sulfuricaulis sp.]|uniref:TonB-dependent receptor plug domain-containing protein n=1 Tax=Sulfuricaulis sp. TaxID=2003553 RepID=UPI0034A29725
MQLKHKPLMAVILMTLILPTVNAEEDKDAQASSGAADATLPEIVVQADRDDFEARQTAPATRLVYGREELDRMNELTVGDYLRRLPSVTFTGPPGTPKDVRLRGMDKGYTQILIDGEPVPGGGKERQIQVDRLPLDIVERIEIIRAPTADLPNEGLAGTINIVLRDAPTTRVTGGRLVTGRVFGEKTHKDTWNVSGQYGDATGDVRWLFNASVGQRGELKTKSKSEEGFVAATGVRNSWKDEFEDERTTSDGLDFSPRVNVKLDGGDELVLTSFFSRTDETKTRHVDKFKYNTPATGADYVGDGTRDETEDKLREIARLRAEWKHKLAGNGSLSVYAAVQRGGEEKDKTTLEYNAAGALTKTAVEDAEQDEGEWFTGLKWSRTLGRHQLGTGLEYADKSREDVKVTTENGVPKTSGRGDNFDIREQRWTAFLQDEIGLGAAHVLTPGLRAQRIAREAEAGGQSFPGSFNAVSPSLHYLWRVNGRNNLRASVTETFKPPKFDDLSPLTETKTGTLTDPDKSGNPDLKPETATGWELGWEHFLPRHGGVFGANLFYRDIHDKVESRTALGDTRYVSRPQNVGDAGVWGVELDARPRMDIWGMPELMLRFNYTRLYSELVDSVTGIETRIKDQPPYVYNVGFDWQLPRWDAAWGVNYNYTPRFVKNPAEPLKLDVEPEQKLLDLYVMKRLSKTAALRLTAANLLDMKKDKDKSEFNASGQLTKKTLEVERGGPAVFVALEGKW